jgi:hypothetical protein
VKDVQVKWEKPQSAKWQSALYFQEVNGLKVDGFTGAPAKVEFPDVVFEQVEGANLVNSEAQSGTELFLRVAGTKSHDIALFGNQLHAARAAFKVEAGVPENAVKSANNF